MRWNLKKAGDKELVKIFRIMAYKVFLKSFLWKYKKCNNNHTFSVYLNQNLLSHYFGKKGRIHRRLSEMTGAFLGYAQYGRNLIGKSDKK